METIQAVRAERGRGREGESWYSRKEGEPFCMSSISEIFAHDKMLNMPLRCR